MGLIKFFREKYKEQGNENSDMVKWAKEHKVTIIRQKGQTV